MNFSQELKPLGSRIFVLLAGIPLFFSLNSGAFGQTGQIPQQPLSSQLPKLSVLECEDENCAPWKFVGRVGLVEWGAGKSSVLIVRESDQQSGNVVIDRYDFGGEKDGSVATYTGKIVDDKSVLGTYAWQGAMDKHTWTWKKGEVAQTLPTVIHFCPGNCFTLVPVPQGDHYITWTYGGPPSPDTWTFESFTKNFVILHRRLPPNPTSPWPDGNVIYKGTITDDGNHIRFTSENGGTNNVNKYRLAWGPALPTVPGCNDERDQIGPCGYGRANIQPRVIDPIEQKIIEIGFRAFFDSLFNKQN